MNDDNNVLSVKIGRGAGDWYTIGTIIYLLWIRGNFKPLYSSTNQWEFGTSMDDDWGYPRFRKFPYGSAHSKTPTSVTWRRRVVIWWIGSSCIQPFTMWYPPIISWLTSLWTTKTNAYYRLYIIEKSKHQEYVTPAETLICWGITLTTSKSVFWWGYLLHKWGTINVANQILTSFHTHTHTHIHTRTRAQGYIKYNAKKAGLSKIDNSHYPLHHYLFWYPKNCYLSSFHVISHQVYHYISFI